MNFERYAKDFNIALKASQEWNLDVDTTNSPLLQDDDLSLTAEMINNTIAMHGFDKFKTSCGPTHATHRFILREQNQSFNPIITIGWVDFQGRAIHETSRRKLRREIKKQAKRKSFDTFEHHVWLTLRNNESIQIVDCTFGYYLYSKGLVSSPEIWMFDTDSPFEGHKGVEFFPLLAGREALNALNVLDENWIPIAAYPR